MKPYLIKKISIYCSSTGLVLSSLNSNADIIYTDVNPDTLITKGGNYDIDFNKDGEVDFKINNVITSFNWINGSGSFVGYLVGNFSYVSNLSSGFSVTNSIAFLQDFNGTVGWGVNGNYYGQFLDVENAFIGVRFNIDSALHLGWIRVNCNSVTDSIIIKDYAYNDISDSIIVTGYIPQTVDSTSNLLLRDVSDNQNSTDIELTFNSAQNESNILEYRAILIKTEQIPSFTQVKARTAQNYVSITPDSSLIYTVANGFNGVDVGGDSILQGISYTAVVLSVPELNSGDNHNLAHSNAETLTFQAEKATNLILEDVDDNFRGNDLRVSFKKIDNENTISEYRVFVVKSEQEGNFSIDEAETNLNGLSLSPIGIDFFQILPVTMKDTDGDLITSNVAYKFAVLSVGQNGGMNNLSDFSNELILSNSVSTQENINIQLTYFQNENFIEIIDERSNVENLSIIDLNGKIINTTTSVKIDISNLKSGLYIASVKTNLGVKSIRFFK